MPLYTAPNDGRPPVFRPRLRNPLSHDRGRLAWRGQRLVRLLGARPLMPAPLSRAVGRPSVRPPSIRPPASGADLLAPGPVPRPLRCPSESLRSLPLPPLPRAFLPAFLPALLGAILACQPHLAGQAPACASCEDSGARECLRCP